MKMRLPLVATVAVAMFSATSAAALPLTYATAGVVGTIDGVIDGGVDAELAQAQALLNLLVGGSINDAFASPCSGAADNFSDSHCKKANTAFDYSGTLTNLLGDSAKIESPQGQQLVVTGFDYVLAKYDCSNAGYILFYLPVFGSTIPVSPDNFWTTTSQYTISHLTRFNASTTVPDGGATLGLLGLGLMGLGYVRRRLQ
jgi:hypothetical protein